MLGRIGPGGQLAFDRGLGEHVGVGHQSIDRVDALVQVVLDLVEIAVVVVRDLRRDIALADPVDILGRDLIGPTNASHSIVDARRPACPSRLRTCSASAAGRQLAVDRRLDQLVRLRQQPAHRVDAVVQVVLDLVELAVVGVGDLRRDVALADPVHVLGRHVQRADDGVARCR